MLTKRIIYLILATLLTAAGTRAEQKNLAPYFKITSAETSTDHFPLKSSKAKVTISGTIAQVELRQTYANASATPLEAIYIFPGSTRSAVHGMEMKIGQRTIRAKIQERKQARATYEKAKSEHQTTSLLEQQRPNVFQMNVANIQPGDQVEVLLRYTEQLIPTDGNYEFVMPTVVGPRFSKNSSADQSAANNWVANPYITPDTATAPSPEFHFSMDLRTGLPLKQVLCTSHTNNIKYLGKQHASLTIDSTTDPTCTNRDIIIRYRLADKQIESGLLLHQGNDENFFLLNIQPPERVTPADIPPRDYLFVVDVSGSMSGFPIRTAGKLLEKLTAGLRQTDTFNVLLFAGHSQTFSGRPVKATTASVRKAIRFMKNPSRHGGGTRLVDALKRALAMPGGEHASRSIVVITDGYIDFEAEAFDLIRNNRGKANVFSFGIGSSVNRHLIEGIARVGAGEPYIVTHPAQAGETAQQFHRHIASPVLTNIRVSTEGFQATDLQPTQLPDMFASRPINLCGKWHGTPEGKIILTGLTGNGKQYQQVIDVRKATQNAPNNPALRSLWARERVREIADYAKLTKSNESVQEVTNLGLTYELLTPYTSFVAVDETPAKPGSPLQTVKHPLPLPQGVSAQAIAGSGNSAPTVTGGSVPEPTSSALFLVTTTLLLFLRIRRCPQQSPPH